MQTKMGMNESGCKSETGEFLAKRSPARCVGLASLVSTNANANRKNGFGPSSGALPAMGNDNTLENHMRHGSITLLIALASAWAGAVTATPFPDDSERVATVSSAPLAPERLPSLTRDALVSAVPIDLRPLYEMMALANRQNGQPPQGRSALVPLAAMAATLSHSNATFATTATASAAAAATGLATVPTMVPATGAVAAAAGADRYRSRLFLEEMDAYMSVTSF